MEIIENKTFDMERALYGSHDITVKNCRFDGPADGESTFKECGNIEAENCYFNLRYPFWHDHGLKITGSDMTELCRAALWYSDHIEIAGTKMHGIKALRECAHVVIRDCDIASPEFGWSASGGGDGRDKRAERVFHDAFGSSDVQKCKAEGKIFLSVHRGRGV